MTSQGQGHSSTVKGHRTKISYVAHLPLMGSPQAQIGYVGIYILDTGTSMTFPRSRSQCHGQRIKFHAHAHLASWVVHRHKLAMLLLICWTQGHKIFKVKLIAPRSKVTGSKFNAHAHLLLMGSSQAHIGINILDTGGLFFEALKSADHVFLCLKKLCRLAVFNPG